MTAILEMTHNATCSCAQDVIVKCHTSKSNSSSNRAKDVMSKSMTTAAATAAEGKKADHPGECAEGSSSFDISHPKVGQVGGDPALQDEEAKTNDAVYPAQSYHLHCVVCCAWGRCLAYPYTHIAGTIRYFALTWTFLEEPQNGNKKTFVRNLSAG